MQLATDRALAQARGASVAFVPPYADNRNAGAGEFLLAQTDLVRN
jgi:hypothetical protein